MDHPASVQNSLSLPHTFRTGSSERESGDTSGLFGGGSLGWANQGGGGEGLRRHLAAVVGPSDNYSPLGGTRRDFLIVLHS